MATKRMNGDEVEHGEVKGVYYDRPYRWYWNPYGVKAWLPADPVQMSMFMEGGWALSKPAHPLKQPTTQKMADGTEYDFGITGQEVSPVEKKRMQRNPSDVTSNAPTATYYSANGDELPNLPADPTSMHEYLTMGLTLTPPAKASGELILLKQA